MDEDEYRLKSVELQTRQVVLTEEQNKKLDALATKQDVKQEGEKTRAAIPDKNGDSNFYRKLIIWLTIALFVSLGLTSAIDFIAGA